METVRRRTIDPPSSACMANTLPVPMRSIGSACFLALRLPRNIAAAGAADLAYSIRQWRAVQVSSRFLSVLPMRPGLNPRASHGPFLHDRNPVVVNLNDKSLLLSLPSCAQPSQPICPDCPQPGSKFLQLACSEVKDLSYFFYANLKYLASPGGRA